MESLIAKPKLRRTRRNLNEIRKRACRINNSTFNSRLNTNVDVEKKRDRFKSSIFITSNRLTLLSKTVTSETVTRPFVHKTECSDRNTNFIKTQNQLQCDNNKDCINSDKVNRKTKESISDSSDTDQNNPIRDSVKTDSSFELHSDYGEHDYMKFINDIPKYIHQIAPVLLKTDTIEKKTEFLKKLYLKFDDNNQNYENKCFNSSSMENKTETPISYLEGPHPKSEIQDIKHDVSSPATSFSSLTMCPSPITLYTIDCDSPEYLYYPHKLNE